MSDQPTSVTRAGFPSEYGARGGDADAVLDRAHITVNKNAVPNDPRSPFVTSGVRVGTPALTTRGMKESEMTRIADVMATVLNAPADEAVIRAARAQTRELCAAFPLYPELRSGASVTR